MPLSFAVAVLGCGAASWVDGRPGFPNSLGATPARGWRSWNAYANDVNQTLLERAMAGLARKRGDGGASGASKSLADLGYTDVGLDAGYEMPGHGVDGGCHDAAGHMLINSTRFPSFEAMNAKAHSLGLTSSWYLNSDPAKEPTRHGSRTCAWCVIACSNRMFQFASSSPLSGRHRMSRRD